MKIIYIKYIKNAYLNKNKICNWAQGFLLLGKVSFSELTKKN